MVDKTGFLMVVDLGIYHYGKVLCQYGRTIRNKPEVVNI
jgi:hypothetical protein